MKAYTYIDKGHFALMEKPEPKILEAKDAIVKVTLASICTSDLIRNTFYYLNKSVIVT